MVKNTTTSAAKNTTGAKGSKGGKPAGKGNGKANPKAPAKAPVQRNDSRITLASGEKVSNGGKTRALLLHLLKVEATSPTKAVSRDTIHEKVAGSAVTMWMGKFGLVAVHVEEDRSRSLYLTPEGVKVAKQFKAQTVKK